MIHLIQELFEQTPRDFIQNPPLAAVSRCAASGITCSGSSTISSCARHRKNIDSIAAPTEEPELAPMPPILPVKREWRAAVLEVANGTENH
jgi:hypothetical protein